MSMAKIAVLCDDKNSCTQLMKQLEYMDAEKIVSIVSFTQAEQFLSYIRGNPDVVMLLMKTGPYSVQTAMEAREQNPEGSLIWFSDLDFGSLSYRIHTSWFGMLPAEDEALRRAMERVAQLKTNQVIEGRTEK